MKIWEKLTCHDSRLLKLTQRLISGWAFLPFVLFTPYLPLWFYGPLFPQNRPQGGDSVHFENHWSKICYDKKAEENDKNMFTNRHIQQLQALALQQAVWEISCLVLLPSSCNGSILHSSFSNNNYVTTVTHSMRINRNLLR